MQKTREKVYEFIVDFVTKNLYSPSIREIGDGCGLSSSSTVYDHLMNLQKMGLIEIGNSNSARTIRLIGYKVVKK